MEMKGRTAIVTGGAVRLGRALSLALAEEGANVVVHYGTSADAARETCDAIAALGSAAVPVQADFHDPEAAARTIIERTRHSLGRADILVNSAAIFEPGTLGHTTGEQWDRMFAVNLKAPFFLTQAFAAQLDAEQSAHVVNVADWRATRPGTSYLAYTLTKGALVTLTRSLALELAPRVQVNAIAPGAILPPPGQSAESLKELTVRIPLRRTGSPSEVAAALRFLLKSDFITGEVVHVSGGEHL